MFRALCLRALRLHQALVTVQKSDEVLGMMTRESPHIWTWGYRVAINII